MRHGPSISICEKPMTFLPPFCPLPPLAAPPPPLLLSLRQPPKASATRNSIAIKTVKDFRLLPVDFMFHLLS
jgi:hypothetical protein